MRLLTKSVVCAAVMAAAISGAGVTGAAAAPAGASTLIPLTPTRILDTRSGIGAAAQPIANDATIDVQITGVGGVPAGATSVVLNVTATDPTSAGYFTLYPTGTPRPGSSNLNFSAGHTAANLVIAHIGTGGKVSLYNFGGNVNAIFDVTGYFVDGTAAGRFYPLLPERLVDTRSSAIGGKVAPVPPGGTITIPIDDRLPTDSHLAAVMINITATGPTVGGYLTAYPTGAATPNASNLNFGAGQTIANSAIVALGPNGGGSAITVFNAFGNTDVIVDLVGIFDDGTVPAGATTPSAFLPLDQPARAYDTRTGPGAFTAKEVRLVGVTGAAGAPLGATAAVLNVTATNTTGGSFLSVWPGGFAQPNASSLNWAPGQTVPNFVGEGLATTGANAGQVALFNDAGTADVVIDVTGYFYPLVI